MDDSNKRKVGENPPTLSRDRSSPSPTETVPRPPEERVDSGQKKAGRIGRAGWIAIAVVAIALIGLAIRSAIARQHQQQENEATAKAEASRLPAVQVITPQQASANEVSVLPGSVVAALETTINARTTGYLRRRFVDLGDRVKAGQLLAEVESPDVDQQVSQAQAGLAQAQASVKQARADLSSAQANLVQNKAALDKGRSDLKQAEANLELARVTWERYRLLVQQGAVNQQQADTQLAAYKANLATVDSAKNTVNVDIANVKAAEDNVKSKQANVDAFVANTGSSQANLQRNVVLQSFEKVTAPFTGIITARNIDTGDLISAGGSSTAQYMFKVAQLDPLNVNVSVPQAQVQSIQLGKTAQIRVPQLQNRVFLGKVIRTANSLDPSNRTLLTQLLVENQDGALQPGMSTDVKFTLTRPNPPLIVPDNVLVSNGGGMQVAAVTRDQKVHYLKVVIGRDYGQQAEILSGLQGNEQLIVNPTTNLVEGTQVQIKQPQKPVQAPGK